MTQSEFFTVKELSEYINIKEKTIYAWVSRQVLPYYQLEGTLRFRRSEINSWLEHRKNLENSVVIQRIKVFEEKRVL